VDRPAVHGAVSQGVGGTVLRARHPCVADAGELAGDRRLTCTADSASVQIEPPSSQIGS
jgi:hypothetical protein